MLNIDHVHPTSRGGTNRVGNLVIACTAHNEDKSNTPVETYLAGHPTILARVNRHRTMPLRDAAATQAVRNATLRQLDQLGLPIECATGGHTKYNRTTLDLPKAHAVDALCVGHVDAVTALPDRTLVIGATGRGTRQRILSDRHGFARGHRPRTKRHHGFQTGDLVRAVIPTGKKAGVHTGRVAVRSTGSFNIRTRDALVQGIHRRHVRLLQRGNGYSYHTKETLT